MKNLKLHTTKDKNISSVFHIIYSLIITWNVSLCCHENSDFFCIFTVSPTFISWYFTKNFILPLLIYHLSLCVYFIHWHICIYGTYNHFLRMLFYINLNTWITVSLKVLSYYYAYIVQDFLKHRALVCAFHSRIAQIQRKRTKQ